jgi:hypothetical protein
MTRFNLSTEQLVELVTKEIGSEFTTSQLRDWVNQSGFSYPTISKRLDTFKIARGQYRIQQLEQAYSQPAVEPVVIVNRNIDTITADMGNLVPENDTTFVPFGCFNDVKKIIKSKIFFPLFITGLSGNGKTHAVEQACAQLNREIVRVNITIETSEDDLLGGYRLLDGQTVWSDGPVVQALRRGAILLLDEVDLASNKVMCLQPVLEGKGVFLKKTNTYIRPSSGFNVIATANTKGRGSDDGRFIGTNILNEAFLERFAVTFQQEYPSSVVETKILTNLSEVLQLSNTEQIIKDLTTWSDIIRKTFVEGGIDDVISTRRLIHVLRAYAVWGNISKAIELTTNRFDDETREVFLELFRKISSGEEVQSQQVEY